MSPWWLLIAPVAAAFFFACGYGVRYCDERIHKARAALTDQPEMERLLREPESVAMQMAEESIRRHQAQVTGPAMSPEEMRRRADLSRNSTPAEIAARLRAERRERAERAAARHALTEQPEREQP